MMTKRDRVRGRMALATMPPATRRLIQVTLDGIADLEVEIGYNRSIAGAAWSLRRVAVCRLISCGPPLCLRGRLRTTA